MPITVHDTLTGAKRPFEPITAGSVGMYVCGPTVYDDCHIGHLMGPILFDAVARWLAARGYRVRFVNNITDIDDKIIDRAQRTGEDWRAITERYTAQYVDLLADLGVTTVTDHPRATDFIPQMIRYIDDLVGRDRAYLAADGVYFDVARQPGYGKLSRRDPEELRSGARVDAQQGLRQATDFCLWKLAKPGEPSWDSPWGAGRPGWHIECSVMSSSLLGDSFDIHGGGDDLKFPHHENEIAQGEAHGGDYAHLWMHNGLIQYQGAKISKSDPRNQDPAFRGQFKARNVIARYGAPAIRFFFLQGHYRRPFDFAPDNLRAAHVALAKLLDQLGPLAEVASTPTLDELLARPLGGEAERRRAAFVAAMDDDFATGAAFGHLFALAREARKGDDGANLLALVRDLGRLLGCFQPGDRARLAAAEVAGSGSPGGADEALVGGLVELLVELRQAARGNRDFATADRIRDRLGELGIAIRDGKDGTSWEPAKT